MTLRRKTLLISTASLVLLTVALYLTASSTLHGGFVKLEEQDVLRDVRRALGALNESQRSISAMAGDYSHWDDTYAFVLDGNQAYIQSNLVDSTFSGLKINLIAYVNNERRLVYAQAFDLDAGKQVVPPGDLAKNLDEGSPLLLHSPGDTLDGLLTLDGKPMLVSARPILTSDARGPVRGTLIMGRYLGQADLASLARVTQLTVSLQTVATWPEPLPALAPARSLDGESSNAPVVVRPVDARVYSGLLLLPDIYGKPAAVLRADTQRGVNVQAAAVNRALLIALLAVGLLFVSVNHALLSSLVIPRITALAADVAQITRRKDPSARVPVTGRDEVAQLSANINGMLAALENSQKALRESEAESRRLAEAEREQRELAEALRDVSALLNGTLQIEEVMERILQTLDRVVPHNAANIMLIENGNARVFRSKGYDGRTADFVLRLHTFPIDATPNLAAMMNTGQPLAIPDVSQYPGWVAIPKWNWVRSWAGAPIFTKGEITGFLNVESDTPGFHNEAHANRLQALADQAGIAVKNAKLYGEVLRYALELEMMVQERTPANDAPPLVPILHERLQQLRQQMVHASLAPLDEDPEAPHDTRPQNPEK